jgi:hypothetical protein
MEIQCDTAGVSDGSFTIVLGTPVDLQKKKKKKKKKKLQRQSYGRFTKLREASFSHSVCARYQWFGPHGTTFGKFKVIRSMQPAERGPSAWFQ